MDVEIEVLENNHTQTISTLPKGKETIDCNYVCRIKFKPVSIVERLKARLELKATPIKKA